MSTRPVTPISLKYISADNNRKYNNGRKNPLIFREIAGSIWRCAPQTAYISTARTH